MMPLVDYLIARDGLPPRRGQAYDYLLAGDGLYVVAENRFLTVRVSVASVRVRGLPAIYSHLSIRTGRLPAAIWEQIVAIARFWAALGQEVLLAVTHDPIVGYRLAVPSQVVSALMVSYAPLDDVVLEIHSHHRFAARFSSTDDADEQGLSLYGVLGRLDQERPEVALRVGAYGHFMPVVWEDVFAGDRSAFRDVHAEPVDELADHLQGEDSGNLPH
jgi:PRTRC genetic system protein A